MQLRSKHFVTWLLAILGIMATSSILVVFFWMTDKINQAEVTKARQLVTASLQDKQIVLEQSVADYAYWDFAYDVVLARDIEAIFANIGSSASEDGLFDQLFILANDGQLNYAFDAELGRDADSLFVASEFQSIWIALQNSSVEDEEPVSGIVKTRGAYLLVAAAWITPSADRQVPPDSFPALFVVRRLGDAQLALLAERAQVSQATIAKIGAPIVGDDFVLQNAMGDPIGTLQWEPRQPGTDLRQELLPILLFICTVVLGICIVASRFFQAQHELLDRATRVATTDQLTALANRAGLETYLQSKRSQDAIAHGKLAVMFLDLNKFKALNDEHGHHAGDIALKVTAERLQSVLRKDDFIARLGGDEFICLILDNSPEKAAIGIAERIIGLAEMPISFSAHHAVVMPAIGIAVAQPGMQWETLLSQSDAAMYWAKKHSATKPILFCKSMDNAPINAPVVFKPRSEQVA